MGLRRSLPLRFVWSSRLVPRMRSCRARYQAAPVPRRRQKWHRLVVLRAGSGRLREAAHTPRSASASVGSDILRRPLLSNRTPNSHTCTSAQEMAAANEIDQALVDLLQQNIDAARAAEQTAPADFMEKVKVAVAKYLVTV